MTPVQFGAVTIVRQSKPKIDWVDAFANPATLFSRESQKEQKSFDRFMAEHRSTAPDARVFKTQPRERVVLDGVDLLNFYQSYQNALIDSIADLAGNPELAVETRETVLREFLNDNAAQARVIDLDA